MKFKLFSPQSGSILIYNIVIIFIFSLVLLSILGFATMQLRVIRSTINREQAFQIAEAGADYYQWHLAHFTQDFWDGNASTTPGPYIHDFKDFDTNKKIGKYSLQIIPPSPGSTIVTVKSTGYTLENPNTKRTISVRFGVPSLAQYAFMTHADVWIGDTESVDGEMHANGGIRFDGTGNAPITSAKQIYICQTYHGCGPTVKPGIWGSAPQSTKDFWRFPMPNVDYAKLTKDFADIKALSQEGGVYLPPSNAQGYSLVFQSDGTFKIFRVDSLSAHPPGFDVNHNVHNEYLDYNARTELEVCDPSPCQIPDNGMIFVEDRVWVEGVVKGRATVAAATLPYNAPTAPSILVPNNITYLAKDNTNSLGLVAQKDFLITYSAPQDLEIDAAIIAQNGSAQFFDYQNNVKDKITIFGAVSSFGVWTWSWISGNQIVSGYPYTQTTYDSNLLYSPPPSFPLSPEGYDQISWESD
jgi:hypothetical protein